MNRFRLHLHKLLFCFAVLSVFPASGQNTTQSHQEDTVYAFANKTSLLKADAAISLLSSKTLQRFEPSSFVAAVNTVPGVKMDERSPGSYRISIRGNLLRSAFGVRNVKVYLDGIPFTDASGNTYFNQLAVNSIEKMEIIKGPAGSMYGAGTGGTILLSNEAAAKENNLRISGGSYGLFNADAKYYFGKKFQQTVSYVHQQSDGWRDHTGMRRDVGTYHFSTAINKKNTLSGNLLYSNLYYQTPGGLTSAQVAANPRQSRPAAGVFKSAEQQQAAIYLSTIYASVSNEIIFNNKWSNRTGGYFTYTGFKNPTIRNYEQKNEKGTGARTVFNFKTESFSAAFGAEYQYLFINTSVFNNNLGEKAALQYHDKIPVRQLNIFAQASTALPFRSTLTAGLSYNRFHYGFNRVSMPTQNDEASFTPQYIPRISLLKKIMNIGSAYLSYSKGYSPPTIDEIHASNGIFNKALSAEKGTNYETGLKLNLFKSRLYADLNYYVFHLQNTIVSRRDASGADYYVNAGKTNQQGFEFSLRYNAVDKQSGFIRQFSIQSAGNYVHARFADYQQGANKYSGNKLTGTSPFTYSILADISTSANIYGNFTYTYTDRIPLNDANTFYGKAYNLLFIKAGIKRKLSQKMTADFFASLQTSFNKNYSLGNDLNADANRFFNPSVTNVLSCGVCLNF